MNASPSPTTANTRSNDPCQAGQLFVTSGQSHSIRQRTAGLIICRSLRINVRMDDLRSAVLPDPHRRHPLVIGAMALVLVVAGLCTGLVRLAPATLAVAEQDAARALGLAWIGRRHLPAAAGALRA